MLLSNTGILASTVLLVGCSSAAQRTAHSEPQTIEVAGIVDSKLSTDNDVTASETLAQASAAREQKAAEGQYEGAISEETLTLFDEPSLPERLKRCSPPETYRLFWFRTFDPPVAIRIDVSRDLAVITVKATDGIGGYVTGWTDSVQRT